MTPDPPVASVAVRRTGSPTRRRRRLFGSLTAGGDIAIDLGTKRIGIAVSDSGVVATPHSVMRNEGDVVAKLASLGGQLEAEEYVVGIPRRTHASANDQCPDT